MNDKNLFKISICDIVLIAVLVVAPVLSLSAIWSNDQRNDEVFIYQHNKLVEVQPLNQDRVLSITNMRLAIENGRIRVLESDCPRHICIHSGWISNPGQTIVCVPNKTIIEVKGRRRSKYHATSY